MNPMYHHSYMNPYAPSYYPQVPPHHYQNGGMHSAPYMPYNPYPQRSPPAMLQNTQPLVVHSTPQQPPQPYTRPPPQQPSPALSTPPPPYQTAVLPPPPPPQVAPVPHTPSSTHSSQVAPALSTPPTPHTGEVARPAPAVEMPASRGLFKYPLPWLSRPELPFPRATKQRRRRRTINPDAGSVELPNNPPAGVEAQSEELGDSEAAAPRPQHPRRLRLPLTLPHP